MVEPSFNNSQSIHHGIDDVDDDLIEEPKLEPHIAKSLVEKFNEEGLPTGRVAALDVTSCQSYSTNSSDHSLSKALRSMHVSHEATKLVALAEKSEIIYRFIMNDLDKTLKVASSMETEMLAELEAPFLGSNIQTSMDDQVQLNELSNLNIGDPRKSNTKGRKKDDQKETQNKRLKSGIELSCSQPGKKKRKCKNCGEYGHYQTSCKK
ncbi:hypothetical protein ACFE04_016325 [Oxalis oulophora]